MSIFVFRLDFEPKIKTVYLQQVSTTPSSKKADIPSLTMLADNDK